MYNNNIMTTDVISKTVYSVLVCIIVCLSIHVHQGVATRGALNVLHTIDNRVTLLSMYIHSYFRSSTILP